MNYIVYVTKNIVTNILYIGVHKTQDADVFDGYIGCGVNINRPSSYAKPHTPFQLAVKKYGIKNFVRSIIKVCDTKEEAYKLEGELVTIKEVYSDKYYNCQVGGIINTPEPKTIYQYSIDGKFIKEWNRDEAGEMYLVSNFSSAIRHKQKLAGFYWSYDKLDQLDMNEYSKPNIPQTIYEYSKEGVCIGIYESLHDFKQPGKICRAIQTNKLYKDKYYSYTLYEKFIPKITSRIYKDITIYIYDQNGNYYDSAKGIINTLKLIGGKSRGSLYDALNLQKPYKGFQFSLEKKDSMPPVISKTAKKPVDVFDIYGNLLKTYNSTNEAISDLHLDSSTVHRCLKGTARQTKGYILKYHKDS